MNAIHWSEEKRFFLPNEDARAVRAALDALPRRPRHPAFVGGSGMLALDVLPWCAAEDAVLADVSEPQIRFLRELMLALADAPTPAALRTWFADAVYPRLRAFYARRGEGYPLDDVLRALRDLFHILFFQDPEALTAVRAHLPRVRAVHGDMTVWLDESPDPCDFVHLSNIADYLPPQDLRRLFAACARRRCAVFCILTTACPQPRRPREIWEAAGYAEHPVTPRCNAVNRALGAIRPTRSWMRAGSVHLLVPNDDTGVLSC